jgi:hypothetical protein
MQIFGVSDEYVVVSGKVFGKKKDGTLRNIYFHGRLIDPSLEEHKSVSER